MRPAFTYAVLLGCGSVACSGISPYTASNSTKMAQAAGFAGAAAVAQVIESAVEARARNNAPVTHSSTALRATPQCDNDGQYVCVTVTRWPSSNDVSAPPPSEPEITRDQARDYVLAYVNGVRKLNAFGPLVRDPAMDAFAQAGSDQVSLDHLPSQHMIDHAGEIDAHYAELQGSPDGSLAEPLQEQIGAILLRWMEEAPEGPHRSTLTRPEWRRIGIGVATLNGRMYFTVDLSL
jgi:uncharacterized protein YkwD